MGEIEADGLAGVADPEPPAATDYPQRIDRFQVRARLGIGTYGAIYRAYDPQLAREVLLKVLQPGVLVSSSNIERFLREAQAAAQLRHPHLAPVYYAGQSGEQYYIASALLEGRTLDLVLRASRLDWRSSAQIVLGLAEALDYVHGQGIVHRDIKPANVVVNPRGTAYLCGIRPLPFTGNRHRPDRSEVASTGPAYLAPELGINPQGSVLPASDQYSLGAVFYEMLCGQAPFRGSAELVLLLKAMDREPPRPRSLNREIPRQLEKICLKAMALRPGDRYPSCREMADHLRHWLARDARRAQQGTVRQLFSWCRQRPAQAVQTGIAALCLVVASIVAVGPLPSSNRPRTQPHEFQPAMVSLQPLSPAGETPAASLSSHTLDQPLPQTTLLPPQESKPVPPPELTLVRKPLDPEARVPDGSAVVKPDLTPTVQIVRAEPLQPLAGGILTVDLTSVHPEETVHYQFRTRGQDDWQTVSGNRIIIPDLQPDSFELEVRSEERGGAFSPPLSRTWTVQQANPWTTGMESTLLKGHTSAVLAVAFAPDNKFLASAGADRTIRLWDAKNGREMGILSGYNGVVKSIAFSPDSRFLATAADVRSGVNIMGGEVRLWNLTTRKAVVLAGGPLKLVHAVAYAPEGNFLAWGGDDGTVTLWDVVAGKERSTLLGHGSAVMCLAFAANGKLLATGSADKTVKLWDLPAEKEVWTSRGFGDAVHAVAFSPDGKTLAAGSLDRTIRMWDVPTRRERSTLTGHTAGVFALAFSPNGQTLATASRDLSVREWDVETGREHGRLANFVGEVYAVAYSPDGKTLATGSTDAAVRLWDAANRRERAAGQVEQGWTLAEVNYDPEGKDLVTLWKKGTPQPEPKPHHEPPPGPGPPPLMLPGFPRLAFPPPMGGRPGFPPLPAMRSGPGPSQPVMLRTWDTATGKARLGPQEITNELVSVSTLSSDGRLLALGVNEKNRGAMAGVVRIWDLTEGKRRNPVLKLDGPVYAAAFSPDNRYLATSTEDLKQADIVQLWDLETGQAQPLTHERDGHSNTIRALVFSPDGQRLATGSDDMTIKLWEPASGKELDTLRGHTATITRMVFASDGGTLASRSEDGTTKIWDLKRGVQKLSIKVARKTSLLELGFSPDGRTWAQGNPDGSVRLWDGPTNQTVATIKEQAAAVLSIAFSPDGLTLACIGADGSVRFWRVAGEEVPSAPRDRQK